MLELYQTMTGSRGSLAEVWIDRSEGIVRKLYKPNGRTIRGTTPLHASLDEIRDLWKNEIYWSGRLRGRHVLDIYEHGELEDEPGYYIIQEYVGPDLLHYFHTNTGLDGGIKDPIGQILELFSLYRENDLYKLNNAMCNLVNDNGRIRAFDFKYAVKRNPEYRDMEMHTVKTWLSKIDKRLPELVESYI